VGIDSGTLRLDDIEGAIRRRRIGRRIVFLPTTHSSNDEAWRRAGDEDADGLVVLTDHQSGGRGRFGRTWHAPRGAGLLCSVLLIDGPGELTGDRLGLIAAIAVRDAVMACTEIRPSIQWPNDVMVRDRKLAGVLIESRTVGEGLRAYVIGIGINCLQHRAHFDADLMDKATSLEIESRLRVDRTRLAIALLDALDGWLADPTAWGVSDLRSRWLAAADVLGRRVRVRQAGRYYEGSIIDVDPQSALVIRLDSGGIRAFSAGDTTVVSQGSATAL